MQPTQIHDPVAGKAPAVEHQSAIHGPHSIIAAENLISPQSNAKVVSKKLHYPMIDALRGFAALSVIVYHVIDHIQWKNFPITGMISDWFRVGWMSVDLFFVISGFVIVLSAVKSYEKSKSIRDFRRSYLQRRLTRIVPLHYLTCGAFLIFVFPEMLGVPRLKLHVLTHALFIHNWHPATIGSINGPNWSLGVEMQFYLIVMLAAGWLSTVRPWVLVATCASISWIWRAGAYALFHDQIRFGNNLTWMYSSQVFGMLDLFAWGGALAILVSRDHDGKFHTWLNRWWLWAGLSAISGIALMKVYWANAVYWTIPAMVTFWRTPEGLFWAFVLAAACGMGQGRLNRITLPFRYLGTISYGIYLWHLPVLNSLKKTYLVSQPESFLLYTVVITCLCASVSWHFFEKPFLDRFLGSSLLERK